MKLSSRELEILKLLMAGDQNKEIAWKLQISVKTVEKHRQTVMKKTETHCLIELINYAVKEGIVDCPCKMMEKNHDVL